MLEKKLLKTGVVLGLLWLPIMLNGSFPEFERRGTVIAPDDLAYNPAGDVIFPSVIRTDRLENPLGRYYLYYAPHDAPAGICLAYADQLEGPWTEYPRNPIIERHWDPHYRVSHVSSPHALWISGEERLFLWFHGENRTTRFASSRDGISFDYEGVAIETIQFPQITEASYARVFEDPSPEREGYVMLFMGNREGRRKIFLARSPDAREWTPFPEPLFGAPEERTPQTSAPWLWEWKGKLYVLAHAPYPDQPYAIYAMETDPELSRFRYAGTVLRATAEEPDHQRVAAPCIVEEDGKIYLFYENGRRLRCTISLAVAAAE